MRTALNALHYRPTHHPWYRSIALLRLRRQRHRILWNAYRNRLDARHDDQSPQQPLQRSLRGKSQASRERLPRQTPLRTRCRQPRCRHPAFPPLSDLLHRRKRVRCLRRMSGAPLLRRSPLRLTPTPRPRRSRPKLLKPCRLLSAYTKPNQRRRQRQRQSSLSQMFQPPSPQPSQLRPRR